MMSEHAAFSPANEQMLTWARGAQTPFPASSTVPELFTAQSQRAPEAVAVIDGETRWSYADLDRRANAVAHLLLTRGLPPGGLVGLPAVRSAAFVASALGVIKAGGAYVPLDVNEPAERQEQRRRDCALVLDPAELPLPEDSSPAPTQTATADSPAYVLYTSGSTGTPKGVVVPHRAITRLVCETDYIDFEPSDRMAFHSNLSFDASTLELWGPLLHGAALVVTSTETVLGAAALAAHIATHGISILWLTTSLFNQLAQETPAMFATLRYLLFGGEAADPASVRQVLQAGPPRHLVNGYGPTETTTFACCHRVTTADSERLPIGRPIANTDAYILDPDLQPAVEGELHIGGPGVALGYLGLPDLTAERFVSTQFGRLYKSGDRARWLPDGTIDYLGRLDGQIKIRGFRIEPGEIEAAMRTHPSVSHAAIVARPAPSGEKMLVGYVVTRATDAALVPSIDWESQLIAHLRAKLPDFMVPAAIVQLEALPLTSNGKLDHRALPAPTLERSGRVAPQTTLERQLAELWQRVLGLSAVGIDDNFFDLGGTSLLMLRVHSHIGAIVGCPVRIVELFQFSTIRALARHFSGGAALPSSVTSRAQERAQQRAALARSRLLSR